LHECKLSKNSHRLRNNNLWCSHLAENNLRSKRVSALKMATLPPRQNNLKIIQMVAGLRRVYMDSSGMILSFVIYSQSTNRNPVTRENSLVLCVTRTASLARAVAAINRSYGPIGLPWADKSARIRPASSAHRSSNG